MSLRDTLRRLAGRRTPDPVPGVTTGHGDFAAFTPYSDIPAHQEHRHYRRLPDGTRELVGMSRRLDPPFEPKGDSDGLLSIFHGLGTEDVTTTCADADGRPLGYLYAVPIDENTVEIAATPGTALVTVMIDDPTSP